jgi:hypothetical protein
MGNMAVLAFSWVLSLAVCAENMHNSSLVDSLKKKDSKIFFTLLQQFLLSHALVEGNVISDGQHFMPFFCTSTTVFSIISI